MVALQYVNDNLVKERLGLLASQGTIWSYVFVWILMFPVAASLGDMASMAPSRYKLLHLCIVPQLINFHSAGQYHVRIAKPLARL